ncbi:MAG: hypothetical protein NWQ53_11245 [Flavobacteriales bacterium]|nr:hypothetical protein [Flavobacteriales bacterium]
MEEQHISVPLNCRYFQLEAEVEARAHWYVLHGYGQLAKYFIKKFTKLPANGIHVTAPEGLHRFYLEGSSGRVGASWMTKEDRETDIANYIQVLNALHHNNARANEKLERVLFGFSQGCATAMRWLCLGNVSFDRIIMWAGSFPTDLPLGEVKEKLQNTALTLVIGDDDEFIKSEHIIELRDLLDQANIAYHLVRFQGGHVVSEETLLSLV